MCKKLTIKDYQKLATERNHDVLTMNKYKNVHSKIEFICHTCSSCFSTTGQSYKNAKQTGCPTCKKRKVSVTHKYKVLSDATKKLIGLKASQRVGSLVGVFGKNHPAWKGGYGRDLKVPSTQDYLWKNTLRKVYKAKCALTNVKVNLQCHHLNAWNAYPEQRFDIFNGVVLSKAVHLKFHAKYKLGNNTEKQFIEFCKLYSIDWLPLKTRFFEAFHTSLYFT